MEFYLLKSEETNPHLNLSWEEYLLNKLAPDHCVFYLWQNDSTVVIGKNQEAAAECDLKAMKKDGITLARRCTGGGAVYHDLGNLNFSFLMPNEIYDVKRQLGVIVEALNRLDIRAEISGRNDLTVDGAKISGNAFITRKNHSLHHGTLLVNTDFSAMGKYLTPSVYKLRKKAVSSVASRVTNLASPSVEELQVALISAFATVYDCKLEDLKGGFDITDYLSKHQDPTYLYGSEKLKTSQIEGIYDESYYKFAFNVEAERIKDLAIYSDSLSDEVSDLLDLLPGKGREELPTILAKCFSSAATARLTAELRDLLLAKKSDIG